MNDVISATAAALIEVFVAHAVSDTMNVVRKVPSLVRDRMVRTFLTKLSLSVRSVKISRMQTTAPRGCRLMSTAANTRMGPLESRLGGVSVP